MNAPQGEETIFAEALRLPPEERAAYLAQVTHGDAELRQRIEALLGSYQAGDFLEQAAAPQLRQTLSIPLTEKPGDTIGHYKLLQQIGEGGCGVVYMAEQAEPVRRRVALKIIKLGMDTKSVIARFEAERQALAMMDHPNIAKVFDAGVTDGRARHSVRAGVEPLDGGAQGTDAPYLSPGRPYFVMELVRGKKITDYCDEKKLSAHARLDLFIQVCRAIQHAHQKGIIHRDVKPSNILVTVNDGVPVPKVIDFGIAKATGGQQLTDKTLFTAFEQFIGTPAYMSPEQAVLTSLDIDTRSDIYALGVLLYELLTGRTPFDAKELLAIGLDEMRRTIREQEPPSPSTRLSTLSGEELNTTAQRRGLEAPELVSELRGDLDWIVMKALEKDRARRYETANGLAMDIQRHLNNEPVVACPPSNLYRFRKLIRRNKLVFAAGSAVVASLVIGLTLSTVLFFRERAARRRADEQMRIANAARKVADENMQVTKAVNEFFLGDVLEQAGGEAQAENGFTPEPNLTVREALERAAKQMGHRFKDQPREEVSLQMILGEGLQEMGQTEEGITYLERAVELGRAKLEPEDALTLIAQGSLGFAYDRAGKPDQALPILEQTLKLLKTKLGPDNGETLVVMGNLASAYSHAGKLDQALSLAEETVELDKARLGPTNRDTLGEMSNLGSYYWKAGKLDQAQPLLEQTLKLMKATSPRGDPYTQITMENLAICYRQAGKLAKLEKLFHDRLAEVRQRAPNDPSKLASPVNDLVGALLSEHKYAEAEQVFNDVLTAPILNQPGSAALVRSRGNLRARRGEWNAAAADYRRAIGLRPGDDWIWHSLAAVLVQEGDLAAYREHCRQSLERFATTTNPPTADRISKDCLILPSSGVNLETVGKMEDLGITAVTNYSYGYWFELDKGLGQYRLGHFAAALDWVRRGMAAKTNWKGQVFGQAVRAMAQYRLKQTRQAGVTLSNALELADTKLPKLGSGDLTSGWLDVVLSRVLLREAKGLIGGTSATKAPAQ